MTYADYSFYTDVYGGELPEQKFRQLVMRASVKMDAITGGRMRVSPPDAKYDDLLSMCCCVMIDELANLLTAAKPAVMSESGEIAGGAIASVNSGSESISFLTKAQEDSANPALYKIAVEYLSQIPDGNGVNVLYRGMATNVHRYSHDF